MLILDHISSSSRQEETCIKITISQLHGQTCSKNWQASNKLNTYEAHSPNEQRKSIQSHSLSTHVCNSHLKVNRSQNTSDSCNMLAKNSLIYRSSGMTQSTTQRWISGPSNTRTLLHLCAKLLKSQTHGQNPKTNVIHTGECHINPSNHNWNKPISKSTHKSWHYHKENHQHSVCSNQHIVELAISCLNSRPSITQLHSNQLTHSSCHYSAPPGKNQVLHPNVFCIGTTKPTKKNLRISRRCPIHEPFKLKKKGKNFENFQKKDER